ncbi:MAG TPA: metallophosphoesterase, partial [Pyrinomonadaceae bacterium]|nr:metallophosphoesterase [Pyrinomonadaceae bacterium]
MTNQDQPATSSAEARILHISDLHFGASFDNDSWNDLINHAGTLSPNLVIVTGDVVDNPTRWSLARAAAALEKLEQDLSCKVIVVPGNHDTRFLGLIPITWVNPLVVAGLAILFFLLFALNVTSFVPRLILLSAGFVFAGILVARTFFLDFGKFFRRFILPAPGFYSGFGLEIFAFDSATKAVFGARGKIPKKQFVDAQGKLRTRQLKETVSESDKAQSQPYRIGILHHHPLPIPYDDSNEFLMVADNAGAFLAEVSRLGIRLVLHGHKHHSHFSRVTINAGDEKEHELAVLAVGTLSRSGRMDPPEHHFYFLRLVNSGNMEVTPFIARKGGSFEQKPTSLVEPAHLAEQRRYELEVQGHGVKCETVVITTELTADGDMDYREEFHGLHVEAEGRSISELPQDFDVSAITGHIDDFTVGNIDADSGEQVTLNHRDVELTHRSGRISFDRKLTREDAPINFYAHYVSLNMFAMSVQQHKQMFSDKVYTQQLFMSLTPIPTKTFDFIMKFPQGFNISGRPRLLVYRNDERDVAIEKSLKDKLRYYPHINLIMARIQYPRLDLSYLLDWTLKDEAPPSGNLAVSLEGRAEQLAKKLLQVSPSDRQHDELQVLMKIIEEKARDEFQLEIDDLLEVTLMAYDKSERA